MKNNPERLFPFAVKARILIAGRENLARQKKKLAFVLITTDISENSRDEIHEMFGPCPIIQKYLSAEIEQHFGFRNCKVLGFRKSPLALSIYREIRPTQS
jgi:hypothetical protein